MKLRKYNESSARLEIDGTLYIVLPYQIQQILEKHNYVYNVLALPKTGRNNNAFMVAFPLLERMIARTPCGKEFDSNEIEKEIEKEKMRMLK